MKPRAVSAVVLSSALPALAAAAWVGSSRRFRHRLLTADPLPPDLPGVRGSVGFSFEGVSGTAGFRLSRDGDTSRAPVVLIHGWGGSSDLTWRTVLPLLDRPFLAVDLVGHGESRWPGPCSVEASAAGVLAAVSAAGFSQPPILVGHSMGGAVALAALRQAHPGQFSRLVMSATAVWWQTARFVLSSAAAPWLLGPDSPYFLHPLVEELETSPDRAHELVWRYKARPSRRVLAESVAALRRFDARPWVAAVVPDDVTWVVPTSDRVVDPELQVASAQRCGARIFEVPAAQHSFFLDDPMPLLDVLDDAGVTRSDLGASAVGGPVPLAAPDAPAGSLLERLWPRLSSAFSPA